MFKTATNIPSIKAQPPENILGNPSIISLIRQTNIKLTCKKMIEIGNDLCRQDARPLIQIILSPIMVGKCLFDTG
jgi:hypothetical protein